MVCVSAPESTPYHNYYINCEIQGFSTNAGISIVWDMALCILVRSFQPRTLTTQTALKVKAVSSSEMLVSVKQSTQCYILEYRNIHYINHFFNSVNTSS